MQVILKKHPTRFLSLPTKIRQGLVQSRGRVKTLVGDIALASPVLWMPPVCILDSALIVPTGNVMGRACPMKIGGLTLFGAELSAPTVLFSTTDVLRSILVHEFAHCFWWMCKTVEGVDKGEVGYHDFHDPTHSEQDTETQVEPDQWFGPDDARSFVLHHDDRLDALGEAIEEQWLDAGLPVESRSRHFELSGMHIEDRVMVHARKYLRTHRLFIRRP